MVGVFTSYFAAEGLWNLIIIGTPEERRQLIKVYVEEHDVIHWCLEVSQGSFSVHDARFDDAVSTQAPRFSCASELSG